MKLVNIHSAGESVSFRSAVLGCAGEGKALYLPVGLEARKADDRELDPALSFAERSSLFLESLLEGEFEGGVVGAICREAFAFPVGFSRVAENRWCLELFHGPTLAFKDFGARFLAGVLDRLIEEGAHRGPLTVVTATSGDTGAAIADAFQGRETVRVIVLYPERGISREQESMLAAPRKGVHAFAVPGDFDACQGLVKGALAERSLSLRYGLNSANSINAARLLAQMSYYVEAASRIGPGSPAFVAVPSGNFGNLCSGLLARQAGIPFAGFVAGTNANDTVPRYLATGEWLPLETKRTASNSMDIAMPNNWPRIERILAGTEPGLAASGFSDEETFRAMSELRGLGLEADPHTAVAWAALQRHVPEGVPGVFLATAHASKFPAAAISSGAGHRPTHPVMEKYLGGGRTPRRMRASLEALEEEIRKAWAD